MPEPISSSAGRNMNERRLSRAGEQHGANQERKLRSACDACHSAKIRCSGGAVPCTRCERDGVQCHYSFRANLGKPKGSLNKKTLERLRRNAEQQAALDPAPGHARAQSISNSPSHNSYERNQQFPESTGSMSMQRTMSACDPISTLSMPPQQPSTPLSPANLDDIMGLGNNSLSDNSGFSNLSMFDDSMPDFHDSIDVMHPFSPKFPSRAPTPPRLHSYTSVQSIRPTSCESSSDDSSDSESDECKKLEAFTLFASACTRKAQPSVPPLYMSRHDSFASNWGAQDSYNPMPSPTTTDSQSSRSHTRVGSLSCACACFQTLTEQLCQIRVAETQQTSPYRAAAGIDTTLHRTTSTLTSVSAFLSCPVCSTDLHVFSIASMLLSTTLTLSEALVTPGPQLDIRIGNYAASGALGEVVKTVLVSTELGKLKELLAVYGRKVDCLQGEAAHVDFLRFQARNLDRELRQMTKRVAVPDLRAIARR
ncbi:uncharacterized protein BDZ99DRAFT_567329 [Mytilinidion resinicola]|uniref:Zn(2)-C6 fungal-type domain-containing protein n=1 Tax=Mytilinidion resinicola TaxID=574789 RepID=A0A6A6Z5H0_9PEZI|nr:uncharacterized protein BDZ99DRAFT_567329 [Mytilinidion resinicola]KAF2815497.1 hypothetical protein BDZ99DRAFT_567329 [Mytilinidion resinicola]